MADQSISQLGTATALTGDELTVVVQNGVTKQTQLQDIANLGGPAGPVGPQGPTGPTGPGATIQVNSTVTGAPGTNASVTNVGSLQSALFNFVIPRGDTGANGPTGATGATGPGVPAGGTDSQYLKKVGTTDYVTAWATLPTYVSSVSGTANQINVANGTTTPVISFADNAVLPGTAAIQVPAGTTAQRAGVSPTDGLFRYNIQTGLFEGYSAGAWTAFALGSGVTSIATGTGLTGGPITSIGTISIANTGVTAGTYTTANITVNAQGQITSASSGVSGVSSFSAGTTGFTPSTGSTGAITLAGTLNVANGGTGATTLTGYVKGSGTSAFTASTTIPTTDLSGTVTNAQLANSSITLGTTSISLGGTTLAPAGLTSVTVTQDPTTALQLATKQYVDNTAQGLSAKASCRLATTANITLSGNQTIDGVATVTGNRILVKNQTTSSQNGIYVAAAGAWARSTDMDVWAEVPGSFVFITAGSTQANTGWTTTAPDVGTIDVTAMPWVQFSGAGTYSAGTGLTLTGTVFSITNTAVTTGTYGNAARTITQTVNQQGQITNIFDQPISIPASAINTTIPNSGLTNSAITINGTSTSLGGSISVGTVTSVTGTAPIVSSGGNTPAISMPAATTSVSGYLTSTDWNTFNSKGSGSVTSVSGTGTVSGISLSGTVTSTGNLTLGGTLDLSSPPAIGGTTPAAITGTTITATKYVGVSGGTF